MLGFRLKLVGANDSGRSDTTRRSRIRFRNMRTGTDWYLSEAKRGTGGTKLVLTKDTVLAQSGTRPAMSRLLDSIQDDIRLASRGCGMITFTHK